MFVIFDKERNIYLSHPSSITSVSLTVHCFSCNYQQIVIMANDLHLQFHYTNGRSFYYKSVCDVHGHNSQSEIHLPWQTYCSPYVRGTLYGPVIAEGSIFQP